MSEGTVVNSLALQITSESDKAEKALDRLIKNLEKLEKTCNSTSVAQDKADKSGKKMEDRYKSIEKTLKKVSRYVGYFTDKCSEWFKESNDYVEALNLFEVTMGSGAKTAKEYANELQNLMGIDIKEWMNYQGSFNQMLNGFGLDNNVSNEMSQQLTQIAYDLSSLWNVDVETAFQKVQSGMSGQVKGLKVWGINLSVAQLKETALAHGIELSTSKMTEAQKAALRYVTIMEKTVNVQGDLARTIVTPSNAMRILKAQTTQMRRELGNVVSVIVVKFIPAVQALVTIIDDFAKKLATLMGYELPEIDYSGLDLSSSFAEDLGENLEDANTDAKKLKKTLLGFDEINILNAPKDNTSSILGGGLPDDLGLDLSKYTYDFTKGLTGFDTTALETKLKQITTIVSGALLALGAILTFTGANIPLGLGLMAIGAIGLASLVVVNWDTMTTPLANTIATISGVVGGALLVLGAIFAFSGASIPAGVALMLAGAMALAPAVAISCNSVTDFISVAITTITGIVAGGLLALGAMLALTGVSLPLGIALMAVGAVTLATEVALNWNTTSDKVSETIQVITLTVSSALLAIGMILLLSGGNVALGVAMIAAGALTLASEIAINWNSMSDRMKRIITTITTIVSGALLVIGMTLTVLGHYPLGIALLAAGAIGLIASVALNWDTLKNDLSATIQLISGVVGGALLVVGAILAFSGVGIPLGITLMLAGAASIAVAISLNWDSVKNSIKNVLSSILSIISGASIAIGVLLCLSGAGIPLGIALIRAGLKGVQKADEVSSNPVTKWVKTIVNGAIDLVEKGINKCIHLINSFGFSWDVPDWLQSVVGFKTLKVGFNLSDVSIPRLKTGGSVDAGQLFIARESGPELVMNAGGGKSEVMNNNQIVESVTRGVYLGVRDGMRDSEGSDESKFEFTINLDGEPIYRDTVRRHNNDVKSKGYSPLKI